MAPRYIDTGDSDFAAMELAWANQGYPRIVADSGDTRWWRIEVGDGTIRYVEIERNVYLDPADKRGRWDRYYGPNVRPAK